MKCSIHKHIPFSIPKSASGIADFCQTCKEPNVEKNTHQHYDLLNNNNIEWREKNRTLHFLPLWSSRNANVIGSISFENCIKTTAIMHQLIPCIWYFVCAHKQKLNRLRCMFNCSTFQFRWFREIFFARFIGRNTILHGFWLKNRRNNNMMVMGAVVWQKQELIAVLSFFHWIHQFTSIIH